MVKLINYGRWGLGSVALGLALSSPAQTVMLSYELTIQPVVLLTPGQSAPSNTSVAANPQYELDEAATQQVWAQAGILVNFASNIIFEHDPTDSNSLNSILVPNSGGNGNSGSIFSGNAWSTANQAYPLFSSSTPQINLFLVQSINGSVGNEGFSIQGSVAGQGYGSFTSGLSVSMTSQAAYPNVQLIAHEIGHQLGLYHPSDYGSGQAAPAGSYSYVNLGGANLSVNLMQPPIAGGLYAASASQLYAPNSNPNGFGQLTTAQITEVLKFVNYGTSNTINLPLIPITPVNYTYPSAIPEPATSALLAGVAALLPAGWWLRRKRVRAEAGSASARG